MHRVAVILNESELLRSGYANVTPKLRSLPRLSKYQFESFTTVNINCLFQDGGSSLKGFDSLFITTNATSDRSVLDILRQNADQVRAFLDAGRGVFISSQKKLSADTAALEKGEGATGFLPSRYEFLTVERPKVERDSGIGNISGYSDGADHLLLAYPEQVNSAMVNEKCRSNEFRRHFYRSHLSPKSSGVYLPILVDTSYDNPALRILLMVSRTPLRSERIVASTIALDWEFQEEVLTNILTYITEGPPRVAFIRKAGSREGDYEFLVTSTELSKTPFVTYSDPFAIPENLAKVINTYVFSHGWSETETVKFLKCDLLKRKNGQQSVYHRVYYFQQLEEFLFLSQHSTFSTLDLIIDQSVAWLSSQFNGRMWHGSFWITHDILAMMHANGIDCTSFIAPLLADVRRHLVDGSYDGVMGATCGLLDMILELQKRYPEVCSANGFGSKVVKEISSWILNNYQTQSANDKAVAFLALDELLANQSYSKLAIASAHRNDLSKMLTDAIHRLDQVQVGSESLTEIDISRWIELCLHSQDGKFRVIPLLAELKKCQSVSGEWIDVTRTAHVLVFLLENFDNLIAIDTTDKTLASCEDMIHNGIKALRSRYNEKTTNWDHDMQATAKAIHAIGLYNRRYKYSTQDFLTVLKQDSERMESATLVGNLNHALDSLRNEANELSVTVSRLQASIRQNARIKRFELAWRLISIISMMLLFSTVGYLVVYHGDILNDITQAIGIPAILISVIVTFIIAWLVEKIVQRSKTDINKLESTIRRSDDHDQREATKT